jgi:predicted MFS family arabinose efflux permease
MGAALIMPAIVALVASNFRRAERPRAYGLVAASGAIAVAAGPLIGGLLTTYASWRWVFAGEIFIVLGILLLTRRMNDVARSPTRLDLTGTILSATGLGLVVMGILKAGSWGLVAPKPEAPSLLGLSLAVWLVFAGGLVLRGFLAWEQRQMRRGAPALIDPAMLENKLLRGGLTSFFFQYLLQAGVFFCVPLFLSVALGLSAVETGVRILPLSVSLLVVAVGVPKLFPDVSPRRVVRLGFVFLFAGIVMLMALLELGAGPEVVTWPLLLTGVGVGALASQLGSVTVSSVPDEQSSEVGGLQNTLTNLGASIGTALAGAVLISGLTASFLSGIQDNPEIPQDLSSQAQVELGGGVPFVPDDALGAALSDAGIEGDTAQAVMDENRQSRLDGLRAALFVLALLALAASFFVGGDSHPTARCTRRAVADRERGDVISDSVRHPGPASGASRADRAATGRRPLWRPARGPRRRP